MIAKFEIGSFERLNPTIIEVLATMAVPVEQVDTA